jgi:4-hydroxy-tetrahydrodipicolinate synthase
LIDDNNWEEARKLFLEVIYPLAKAMFIETNPVPVKQALEFMGYASSEVRLPLVRMKEENKERLRKIMEEVGVL